MTNSENAQVSSNSNPLRELPPEFDASAREAMRTKARRTKHECMAEMSDEWLANELRMLSRHDLWHEPFCVAARDRIMRLSMQLAEARGVIDALKSRSAETSERCPEETGWLIELAIKGIPHWLMVSSDREWTTDSTEALRFAREQDAEAMLYHSGLEGAKATGHTWSDANTQKAEGGGT